MSKIFKKFKNLKKKSKIQKNHFFYLKILDIFFSAKKMSSSQFFSIRRTQFGQSSPVQPVLGFRGSTSVTDGGGRSRKSLCLIQDLDNDEMVVSKDFFSSSATTVPQIILVLKLRNPDVSLRIVSDSKVGTLSITTTKKRTHRKSCV